MPHTVLARKWRPKTFQEMIGQQHVLQALINALEQNRLHHAYLFTGTRGVGKTTIARILAKCLNCEQGVSSTPCEQCSACTAINAGRFVDLIEVDAASRTKVEDTRELLDNVQYLPTQGRFKIYLIDEVHMLSGHSFNALLKTLEEPPEHVKFLLATTDPQKLPVTVLSRCLQFYLKNLLPEQISEHLATILQQEDITFEPLALKQLARAAKGSVRDGLSLLDQAIGFSNGQITAAHISQMLGTIEQSHTLALLQALLNHDAPALFDHIQTLAHAGIDFHAALEDLLTLLHQIAILKTVPNALGDEVDDRDALIDLATAFSAEDLQLFYQIALIGRRDLPLAPSAKVGFEMILLRMLTFQPAAAATTPPAAVKKKTAKPVAPPKATKQTEPKLAAPAVASTPDPSTAPKSSPEAKTPESTPAVNTNIQNWGDLIKQLSLNGISLALAQNCVLHSQTQNRIELRLPPGQAPLLNDATQQRIADALTEHFAEPINLHIELAESEHSSPAKQASLKTSAEQQAAEQAIQADPNIQTLLTQFDAIITPGSVKPNSTTS